jgi:hypothetical protein
MPAAELERLWRPLERLSIEHIPLLRAAAAGEPLWVAAESSKVHWVRPEMVEVDYAEWAPGRLLRQVVYLGKYGDKPATDMRRCRPG